MVPLQDLGAPCTFSAKHIVCDNVQRNEQQFCKAESIATIRAVIAPMVSQASNGKWQKFSDSDTACKMKIQMEEGELEQTPSYPNSFTIIIQKECNYV